jgi:hypothetical protein
MTDKDILYLIVGISVLVGLFMIGKTGASGIISKMADAIQSFEGWSIGSTSFRNNNPGNLKYNGQAGSTGMDDRGFAIFQSYAAGRQALENQLSLAFNGSSQYYSPSMSLYDFFSVYSEDNSSAYAEYVAAQLGVSPDTQLSQLA